jgi:hypothetical protein
LGGEEFRLVDLIGADELQDKLQQRYARIWDDLKENETLRMEYHAPTGEVILVDQVAYYRDTEAVVLAGYDDSGNECQVIASPLTVHIIFRVVQIEEGRERKRVGFTAAPLEH